MASACQRLRFALQQWIGAENPQGIGDALLGLAQALFTLGPPAEAMQLAGAAARHGRFDILRGAPPQLPEGDHRRILAEARSRLDDPALAAAWAKGQAMTLDQAVEYALSLSPA